ncbi:MAG: biosynthetic-type acetolactate synthase large subunit [Anaerolineae bacterium]|jgi:acetolactate synthase-1/2/3 large subunit|nr:biosynthetic-type acetolactate synthase large subunit [Anaerolineae bacterium]
MLLTGAEILLECLIREGVEVMFGYPGGAILPTYDAMAKYPQLKHVLVRHEQGASHMADGYARASGRVGVCIATSGPGATNLVTGLATAMMDSVGIVAITGQVSRGSIGTDAFQETDVTGVTLPVTKHNYLVMSAAEIPHVVHEAFHIASSGRPGPVLIDIPKDVQTEKAEFKVENYPPKLKLPGYQVPKGATETELESALELIRNAKKPLILAGHGIMMSGAVQELRELAELAGIPVTLTLLGKGAMPENHPLCLGMMGMHGNAACNYAIQEADLLIALGMRFDDRVTGNLKTYSPNSRKIHVEIDPSEINKNVKVDVGINGDLRTVMRQLVPGLPRKTHPEWMAQIRDWQEDASEREILTHYTGEGLLGAQVVNDLWRLTDGNAITVSDVGQHQMLEAQYYPHQRPQTMLTSGGLGTMGFGFPAAIGAKFAKPDEEVWAVVGDGGFQMTLAELATARQENVPVKIAILNNSFLGMVRQWQEFFYEERYQSTPMVNPDFCKLAEAYGIPSMRVTKRAEIEQAVAFARSVDGPVLIEFQILAEEIVYPMVPAGNDLHNMIRRPKPGESQ